MSTLPNTPKSAINHTPASHESGSNTSTNTAPTKAVVAAIEHDALEHEATYAQDFRKNQPLLWWATLIGPFLVTGALLGALALTRGVDFVAKLAGTGLVTFFGIGRFVILFGSDTPKAELAETIADGGEALANEASKFNFLTRMELFTMVTWMDLFAACILIFHLGFIFKIPKIGPKLALLREEGEFFMHSQPWMRRFSFIGLTLFVMIPVAATGSVGGAIFGRLLGMSRGATFAALLTGTLLGNGVMLVAGRAIAKIPFFNPNNPLNLVAGAVIVVGIIMLLNWRYQKMKKAWKDVGGVGGGGGAGKQG